MRVGDTTYPSLLNLVGNLHEELLVFGGILASHQDFDREPATFELIKVLRYIIVSKNQAIALAPWSSYLSSPL